MGDDAFFGFLQQLLETPRYEIVSTETVLAMAQVSSPNDLDPLFEEWFALSPMFECPAPVFKADYQTVIKKLLCTDITIPIPVLSPIIKFKEGR